MGEVSLEMFNFVFEDLPLDVDGGRICATLLFFFFFFFSFFLFPFSFSSSSAGGKSI